MGNEENFCLRWNDFESIISTSFRGLREDKDFFDVTLVCDNNQLQAHKVILSACSPFFRSVLKRNPHQHPLLYLKGVQYESILSVLNFMYHGEVNIAQEHLNSFLAVAEDLQVKGLAQNISTTESLKPTPINKPAQDNLPSPVKRIPKQARHVPPVQERQSQEQPIAPVKTETPVHFEVEEESQTQIVLDNQYQAESFGYDHRETVYDEQIEEGYDHDHGNIDGKV